MVGKSRKRFQNYWLVTVICLLLLIGAVIKLGLLQNGSVISETEAKQIATSSYSKEILQGYNVVLVYKLSDGWFYSIQPKDGEPTEGGHSVLVSDKREVKIVSSGCWPGEDTTVAEYDPCI